jgi:RNase P/RNase MRP subunit p29
MKNIEQLMAEADPVRTLSQTGSVRMLKRLSPDPASMKALTETPPQNAPVKLEPPSSSVGAPPSAPAAPASPNSPASAWTPPPFPTFKPAAISVAASVPTEVKKADPVPSSPVPAATPVSTGAPPPKEDDDSPFILKPAAATVNIPKIIPPSPPSHAPLMPFGSIFRRKAKMTELARIVLPSKREESEPHPATPSASSPTVVPPAFPVVAMTVRANHPPAMESQEKPIAPSSFPVESAATEKIVVEEKPSESSIPSPAKNSPPTSSAQDNITAISPPDKVPDTTLETPKSASVDTASPVPASIPAVEEKPAAFLPDLSAAPKVDPEAHKPEPAAEPLPRVDPEAHKAAPPPAPPIPSVELSAPSGTPEKREFHLANGERVAGTVLSETPEAVYIEHGTLGVLTIPRAQIAKRLVEIILINGDRIVGDIMAETADTLYVRHASLGMLTVPRAQRSTRVVEAILKDGDRILGEVLTETDTFTVIRSATLGTITVPHSKMSMLNRKIEQIELKALPPSAPEIKEKS